MEHSLRPLLEKSTIGGVCQLTRVSSSWKSGAPRSPSIKSWTLNQCWYLYWFTICAADPAFYQLCANVLCLLDIYVQLCTNCGSTAWQNNLSYNSFTEVSPHIFFKCHVISVQRVTDLQFPRTELLCMIKNYSTQVILHSILNKVLIARVLHR